MLRTLSNSDQPFRDERGFAVSGLVLQFTLVDASGNPPSYVLDKGTGEYVVPFPATVPVNDSGEFTIDLWPTDQSLHPVQYKCAVIGLIDTQELLRPLPSGDGPMTWYEFLSGEVLNQVVFDDGGAAIFDDGTPIQGG